VLQGIDGKGRVAIPASMRGVLEGNSATRAVVLSIHPTDPCIQAYDLDWADILHSRLERDLEREKDNGRVFDEIRENRRGFGLTEDLPFDSSGRFILPAVFKRKAQLDDVALFLGTGNTFEIWNPRLLLEAPGIDEDTKFVATVLMEERAAK